MGNSFEKFVFTGGNPGHVWDRHRHRTMPTQQNQHQQCGGERHHVRQQQSAKSQTGMMATCGCTTKGLPHGNSTPNLGGSYILLTTSVKRSAENIFQLQIYF